MNRLRLLIVSDGLPGHLSQSRGLAHWLSSRYEVHSDELLVQLRMRAVARRLLPPVLEAAPALATLRAFYRLQALPAEAPDLVASAGGNTSFANALLARHYCVPNVFIGSRRRIAPSAFSAHLTLEPTGDDGNIVTPVAPSPISPAENRRRGAVFRRRHNLGDRLWLMACGGNGAGKTYTEAEWAALAEWMNDAARAAGVRWLISTSRRTGSAGETALASRLDDDLVAYAVWWNRRPERILGALMGAAERLFVTVDSMSMISECIGAGKPLVLVDAGTGAPPRNYAGALERYQQLGLCGRAPVAVPYRPAADEQAPPGDLFEATLDRIVERIGRPIPGR